MAEERMDSSVMKSLIQQYSTYYCREVIDSILKAVNCSNFSKKYSLMNLWHEKVLLLGFLHGIESGELGLSGLLAPNLEKDLVSDLHVWLPVEYSCALEELSANAQRARDSGLFDPSSSSVLSDIIRLPKAASSTILSTSKNISLEEIKELTIYSDTIKTLEELLIEKIKKAFEYITQYSKFSSKFTLQTLWPSKALFITLLYGLISHDIALCSPAFKLFSEIQSQDDLEASDLKQSLLYEFKFSSEDICKANEYFSLYKCHSQGTIPDDLNNVLSAILEGPVQMTNNTIDAQKGTPRKDLLVEKDKFLIILNSKITFSNSTTPNINEESDVIEVSDEEMESKESLKKLVSHNSIYDEFNKLMEDMVRTGKLQELLQKSLIKKTTKIRLKGHKKETPKKTKGNNSKRISLLENCTKKRNEEQHSVENEPLHKQDCPVDNSYFSSVKKNSLVEKELKKVLCKNQVSGEKEPRRSFRKKKAGSGSLLQSKTTEEGSLISTEAVSEPHERIPTSLKKNQENKTAKAQSEKEFIPANTEVLSDSKEAHLTILKKRGRKTSVMKRLLEKELIPADSEVFSVSNEADHTTLKKWRRRKVTVKSLHKKEYSPMDKEAISECEKALATKLKKGRKRKVNTLLEQRDQPKTALEEYSSVPMEKRVNNLDSKQPKRGKKKTLTAERNQPRPSSRQNSCFPVEKRLSNSGTKQQSRRKKKTLTVEVDPVPVHEKIAVLNKQLIQVESEKKSLLHYAVISGMEKALVKVLKDKTTAVDSTDAHGESALHLAIRTGQDFGLVRALVELGGADVNLPTPKGHTPLHLACMRTGNLFIIKYLIKNGADPHIKDNQGKMPQDVFISKTKNNPVVSFLRSLK